jgi:hypothetical protein
MLNRLALTAIHRQIAELFSPHLVLLGGSYFKNTASADSDLDFYLIVNWLFLFFRKKYQFRLWEVKKNFPQLRVMLVPKIFFKCGWYYIEGQSLSGELIKSKIDKKSIFRTATKLKLFYKLKSLLNNKYYWQKKYWQQQEIIKRMVGEKKNNENFLHFSLVNYLIYNFKFLPQGDFTFLFCNPDAKIIRQLKLAIANEDTGAIEYFERIVFPVIIW